jgi:hypothetical protein
MTDASLSPRARAILAAVEREIAERAAASSPRADDPVRPLRIDVALLSALELAVAGATRSEVRDALAVSDDALDAVFGDGTPPQARLSRRRG